MCTYYKFAWFVYYREFAKRQLEEMKKNGKKGNCTIL